MRIAIDVEKKEFVSARKAETSKTYICPICGSEVTLKKSPKGEGHCFSHGAHKGEECENCDGRMAPKIVDHGNHFAAMYSPGWRIYKSKIQNQQMRLFGIPSHNKEVENKSEFVPNG